MPCDVIHIDKVVTEASRYLIYPISPLAFVFSIAAIAATFIS